MAKGRVETRIDIEANTGRASQNVKSFTSNLKDTAVAVGAVYAGFKAVEGAFNILGDFVRLAAANQRAYALLANSVERAGYSYAVLEDGLKAFTDRLQEASGIADEEFTPALARFIDVTHDVALSMRAVELSLDLAQAKGEKFESVSKFLAESMANTTTALKKWGVEIDQTLPKYTQWLKALEGLEKQVGGAAEKTTDLAEQWATVKQQFGDLKEVVGALVTGPLSGALEQVTNLLKAAKQLAKDADEQVKKEFNWFDKMFVLPAMRAIQLMPGMKGIYDLHIAGAVAIKNQIAGLITTYNEEREAAENAAKQTKSNFEDANAVAEGLIVLQDAVIVSGRNKWRILVDDIENANTAIVKAQRIHTAAVAGLSKAFTAAFQQEISVAQGAAMIIKTVIADMIAGELEYYAKLWAAKALAAAAEMNFWAAAKYTAATILATGGAAWIRNEVAKAMQGGEPAGGAGAEDFAEQIEITKRGRTVIAQGPITLNYSAVLQVFGHAYNHDDLFRLFQDWNEQQLRAAGMDVQERARA